jgi:hypothetical protein
MLMLRKLDLYPLAAPAVHSLAGYYGHTGTRLA